MDVRPFISFIYIVIIFKGQSTLKEVTLLFVDIIFNIPNESLTRRDDINKRLEENPTFTIR